MRRNSCRGNLLAFFSLSFAVGQTIGYEPHYRGPSFQVTSGLLPGQQLSNKISGNCTAVNAQFRSTELFKKYFFKTKDSGDSWF